MNKVLDKYNSTYFGRVGNAFSQLAHAISGGDADVSISGKTGYKSLKGSKYWEILRLIIDFTFEPIDGKNHCKIAYLVDKDEKYTVGEGVFQDVVCGLFVLVFCPIIAIFTYMTKLIKK